MNNITIPDEFMLPLIAKTNPGLYFGIDPINQSLRFGYISTEKIEY